ncbi:hypothetical protein [Mesorhizobium sp. M0199]|uniref:hypothetical protein n=1 Tax=unclassified Mesorhizobium TaxID=325217 RepID=UPI00333AAD51
MNTLLASLALTLTCAFTDARAQDFDRAPGENDLAFAKRVVGFADNADPHTTAVTWNGLQTLFVDYQTTEEYPERPLVALQQQPDGTVQSRSRLANTKAARQRLQRSASSTPITIRQRN